MNISETSVHDVSIHCLFLCFRMNPVELFKLYNANQYEFCELKGEWFYQTKHIKSSPFQALNRDRLFLRIKACVEAQKTQRPGLFSCQCGICHAYLNQKLYEMVVEKKVPFSLSAPVRTLDVDVSEKVKTIQHPVSANVGPSQCGMRWTPTENEKLLRCISCDMDVSEIATWLDRSVEGIRSQIRKLAADFWYVEKKTIDEISILTGLSKDEINIAIQRRQLLCKATKEETCMEPMTSKEEPMDSESSFAFYTKSGLPWTEEETNKLIQEYDAGLDILEIGRIHKRTPGGIAYRLKSLNIVYPMSAARGYDKYKMSALYYDIVKTAKEEKDEKQKTRKLKQLKKESKGSEVQELKTQMESMRTEMQEMKKSYTEMSEKLDTVVKLMKLIYEFENE